MELSKFGFVTAILLLGLFSIGALASCSPVPPGQLHEDEPIDGGLTNSSNRNAPKTIQSNVLTKFSLNFLDDGNYIPADPTDRFPQGRYSLLAERRGNTAHFRLLCDRHNTLTPLVFEKDLDTKELDDLHAFLLEHNIPAINGSSKWNSALGTFIDLHAIYDSGETLSVYAEGGASTVPDGWCGTDVFLKFFADKLGARDCLGSPLYSCDYAESSGETGYLLQWNLKADSIIGSHRAIFHRQSRKENGADIVKQEIVVPREKLEELEQLVHSLGMKQWKNLPYQENPDMSEMLISIALNYSDSQESVCIDSHQALPPEAREAMNAVREFLESLEPVPQ